MAKGLLRLGRLGYFVVMAGVSWVVEACSGSSNTPVDPTAKGGNSAGGNSAGGAGTGGSLGGASSFSGDTSSKGGRSGKPTGLGGSAATGRGGEGGLHDVPCE